MTGYDEFVRSKSQFGAAHGFDPVWVPDALFDFQRHLVEWAVRRGRAAIFADCVAGETLVNTEHGRQRIDTMSSPTRVWCRDDAGRAVLSPASPAWVNGYAPLYEYVTAGGRRVRATNGHRFMTPSGWKRGGELRIGERLLVSDASRLPSISGHGPPIQLSAARCSPKTVGGCRGDCSACRRPCDARLHPALGAVRSLIPSPIGVLVRNRLMSREGGPGSESGYTRRRPPAGRPSTPRCDCPAVTTAGAWGYQSPSFGRPCTAGNTRTWPPVLAGTTPGRRVLESHPSATPPNAGVPSAFSFDTLVAVHYIRDDVFYDIQVDAFHNYMANGFVSHNCGLGKTAMQLVWAENVVRHANRPVLVLTPLAVGRQTVAEAGKFGVEAVRSADGRVPAAARVVVANYERLHLFDPAAFAGVVCDESSAIKCFDAKRTAAVTEFVRTVPYRLLCTATAAPNDYVELGTSAEALGEMGFQDMASKFFRKETNKDHLGWGRTTYRLRGHAERDFWRWVCSWARACRKPSDLGFDDGRFDLPPLAAREHVVLARTPRPGRLFDSPAKTLPEQREERRRTLPERCERVAGLVSDTGRPAVAWCHLNDEGDMLTRLIPGAVQVSGADADGAKEESFEAFAAGQIRVLVTKPEIGGFGLNWQHCAHMTFFPSHSFERYYQAVRRCWRFGQTSPVAVDVVTSEGEAGVVANLQRKAAAADELFAKLVGLMGDALNINRGAAFAVREEVPGWLSSSKKLPTPTRRTTATASR